MKLDARVGACDVVGVIAEKGARREGREGRAVKLVWAWLEFLLATGLLLALVSAPVWAARAVPAASPDAATIQRASR